MTIASEVNKSGPYFYNGATTAFPYEFKISDQTHIRVVETVTATGVETDLALNTDYTVTDVGDDAGNVVISPARATGKSVTLVRNVPFTQELDLQNQGAYNAESVEDAFDRAVARDQQLAEQISRAIVVPISSDPTDIATLIGGIVGLLGVVDQVEQLAAVAPEIAIVAGIEDEVVAAALIAGNIVTVAGIAADVTTVAGMSASIATVVANITDIQNAEENAAAAVAASALAAASAALLALPTQGRLTLTSGVSVTESDVVGATAVYLTPTGVNAQPVYDGSAWQNRPFSEMTLTLAATPHPTGKLFDAFVAWQSGAMIFGSGPDWSVGGGSLTARGTGAGSTEIEMFQGRWVNKNAIILKNGATTYASIPARQATLVGGFATVAAGQTTDAANKRWVWSVNGAERLVRMADELTASWAYSTASFRQWNASTANEISWFQGLGGRIVQIEGNGFASTSGATPRFGMMGIGLDSATVNSAIGGGGGGLVSLTTAGSICPARYRGYPGIGVHFAAALERGGGTDTQTFYGVQANFPVGMQGETIL